MKSRPIGRDGCSLAAPGRDRNSLPRKFCFFVNVFIYCVNFRLFSQNWPKIKQIPSRSRGGIEGVRSGTGLKIWSPFTMPSNDMHLAKTMSLMYKLLSGSVAYKKKIEFRTPANLLTNLVRQVSAQVYRFIFIALTSDDQRNRKN